MKTSGENQIVFPKIVNLAEWQKASKAGNSFMLSTFILLFGGGVPIPRRCDARQIPH